VIDQTGGNKDEENIYSYRDSGISWSRRGPLLLRHRHLRALQRGQRRGPHSHRRPIHRSVAGEQEDRLKGFAVKDERTRLLEGRAGRAAFLVGNYIWLALLWYEFAAENWMPWPKIGSPPVLLIGMMAQVAVYFVAMYTMAKSVGR